MDTSKILCLQPRLQLQRLQQRTQPIQRNLLPRIQPKNPTQNPTTNPTRLAVIRLYPGNSATGSIGGTPNDADQIATTQMGLNYPSQAPSCIKIIAMVSFSNRRLIDIPTWAQFSPLSPVKIKDTSTTICTTWQACVAS